MGAAGWLLNLGFAGGSGVAAVTPTVLSGTGINAVTVAGTGLNITVLSATGVSAATAAGTGVV